MKKGLAFMLMSVLFVMSAATACGGGEKVSTTIPTPPLVTPRDAAEVTVSGASLNGNLDDLGTASGVNVSFLWGTVSGGPYLNETVPQVMDAPGAFDFEVTSLIPGTTYYFQAKAVGDGASYSVEKSFTILTRPPTVTSGDAIEVIVTGVRLNGNLADLGTSSGVKVSFIWGETSGGPYPNETVPQVMDAPGAFSFDLTGLTPGTVYFQAKAVGHGTSYGIEKSFVIPVTFPDRNLEAAIREAINKPEGLIYISDLESLTDLMAVRRGISDLTGLEYCKNLPFRLDLTLNNISDLSPLAGLTKLKRLHLGVNKISDLSPLANLTDLQHLLLEGNNISDLSPLQGLTKLRRLHLVANKISDISPLVENSGLSDGDFVDLSDNPLSTTSVNVYIPQLEQRGVDVMY